MRSLFLTASAAALALVAGAKSSDKVNWQNVTGTSSTAFPTAVGNLGDMLYAAPPFVAQENRVNSTSIPNTAIEMRWKPKDADKDNATSADIFRNLGAQSPYHPADDLFPETNAYQNVPEQCEIKQVHILHRHGARNPTDGPNEGIGLLGQKVRNASKAGKLKATGDLAFLKHWNYSLGEAVLVHQGAKECFDSGVKMYYDYGKLMKNLTKHKPVVRTTSQSRMLDTARYWTLGFFGWDATDKVNIEVLQKAKKQNATLEPDETCKNADDDDFNFGKKLTAQYTKTFLPKLHKRLQKSVSGFNFTEQDAYSMMQLCAYETVTLGYSNFCRVFTKKEWEQLEYSLDLGFQGKNGFMSPTGKALGIGWVTEFIDRVTKTKFNHPQTTQNSTLDKNSTYFPLKQPLYADFTHDSIITSVLTAFNFTQIGAYLHPTKPDPHRRYRASRVTPFGARVVFEIMDCKGKESSQYIRVKINGAVLPLDEDQGCKKRKDGLCKLHDFISYQKEHAYKASKFNLACFGKNGTDFTITGPVRNGAPPSK